MWQYAATNEMKESHEDQTYGTVFENQHQEPLPNDRHAGARPARVRAHRGLEIVEEYRDEGISGSKDRRPALDRLMNDARHRKFDVVLVARFDRFARSVKHLITALDEFNHLGVDFISLTESVDTSSAMGKMIFTVLGAVAELERNLIRERVVMGLDRARKQRKQLGRPRRLFDRSRAGELLQTHSQRETARILGISLAVLQRGIAKHPRAVCWEAGSPRE